MAGKVDLFLKKRSPFLPESLGTTGAEDIGRAIAADIYPLPTPATHPGVTHIPASFWPPHHIPPTPSQLLAEVSGGGRWVHWQAASTTTTCGCGSTMATVFHCHKCSVRLMLSVHYLSKFIGSCLKFMHLINMFDLCLTGFISPVILQQHAYKTEVEKC